MGKYQNKIAPERLVFIDETWTKDQHGAAARMGAARHEAQSQGPARHGHWKTTTFLAALRHDRIEAPWLVNGPIDGESFQTYVEKVLVPTLRPGDIVIMDNLGSHKGKAVRRLIRAAGNVKRCRASVARRRTLNMGNAADRVRWCRCNDVTPLAQSSRGSLI
jgi:hypothetical protein